MVPINEEGFFSKDQDEGVCVQTRKDGWGLEREGGVLWGGVNKVNKRVRK